MKREERREKKDDLLAENHEEKSKQNNYYNWNERTNSLALKKRERELRSLLFLYDSGLAWSVNYVKIGLWWQVLCHYHLLLVVER